MIRRRRRDDIRRLLDESRVITDLGTEVPRAKRMTREALSLLHVRGLLKDPQPTDLELLGDASLLLGRQLRLIGDSAGSQVWLSSAQAAFEELLHLGTTPSRQERLLDALNMIVLLHVNNFDLSGGTAWLELTKADQIQSKQFMLFDVSAQMRDPDDQRLEMLQRRSDILLRTCNATLAREQLISSRYEEISETRPEHNRALRLTHLARLATQENNFGAAAGHLEVAQSLGVIRRSNFIQIEVQERLAEYYEAQGDLSAAEGCRKEAHRLREIEQITTR